MRDSRLGTYGVLCLVLSVAARLGILAALGAQLPPMAVVFILMAGGAVSRAAMVGLISHLPPARAHGLAASLSPSRLTSLLTYTIAVAIALAALLAVMAVSSAIIAIIAASVATFLLALLALRQIGGHSGDVAGAAQQIAEISCLLAVVALI